jgi:hypothetical protein
MQSDTKASLKRLGWTAVVALVAACVFLIAMFAGLPQMPTVGFILVAIFASAIVLGRVYRPTLSGRNCGGDESAKSGDSPDRQQRD